MSNQNPVYTGTKVATFASVISQIPSGMALSTKRHQTERLEETLLRIREEAYKDGFREGQDSGYLFGLSTGKREGYKDGLILGAEEVEGEKKGQLNALAQEVQYVRDQLQQAVDDWFYASEQALVDLSMQVAKEVLYSELNITRESVVQIVKNALQHVTSANHARIRINPSDSIYFLENRELLLEASTGLRDCEIIVDPSISAGCIVETDGGMIDARVENRLEMIEGAFYDEKRSLENPFTHDDRAA